MKRRKPLRRVSLKRAKQLREYLKVRNEYLSENNFCEVCGRPAQDLHHRSGRIGEKLTDKANFMALCRLHHTWIHEHPKEARSLGWLI